MIAFCSTCLQETAQGICVGWKTNLLCVVGIYFGTALVAMVIVLCWKRLYLNKKVKAYDSNIKNE